MNWIFSSVLSAALMRRMLTRVLMSLILNACAALLAKVREVLGTKRTA